MANINLGTLGLSGIGETGFKVSAIIWDETNGRPDIVLKFQAAKRINGARVEDRNFLSPAGTAQTVRGQPGSGAADL